MRTPMTSAVRWIASAIVICMPMVTAACAADTNAVDATERSVDSAQSFVIVPRLASSPDMQARSLLPQGGHAGIDGNQSPEDFYIAINKNELNKRWYLSANLKQLFLQGQPAQAPMSLGIRIVRFVLQNDRLLVIDASSQPFSDTISPDTIIDAYPVITGFSPFSGLGGSDLFVLFDPSQGLKRLNIVSRLTGVPVDMESTYAKRARRLADGIGFDRVFAGSVDGMWLTGQGEGRMAGTVHYSIRKYKEGPGFTPTPMPSKPYFFTADQFTEGRSHLAAKWNIYPGMKPIRYVISTSAQRAEQTPPLAGYNIVGTLKDGIESWNQVFGFKAFEATVADPVEDFGDDDVNYVVFDNYPGFDYCMGALRSNPETGEIRGAVLYMNSSFLEQVASQVPDDAGDASEAGLQGLAIPPRAAPSPFDALWRDDTLGGNWRTPIAPFLRLNADRAQGLTKTQQVERALKYLIIHEVGHTLGLRHNFKGSLSDTPQSVMDYLPILGNAVPTNPLPYDVAALRLLHGITGQHPNTFPFCTDHDTANDPSCGRFDLTAQPIQQYLGPYWQSILGAYILSGYLPPELVEYLLPYEQDLLSYVRAGTPGDRQWAWAYATQGIAPGTVPAEVASNPHAVAAVNAAFAMTVRSLFIDVDRQYGAVYGPPQPGDPSYDTIVQAVTSALENSDNLRTITSRVLMVKALSAMQNEQGRLALEHARAAIETSMPSLTDSALLEAEEALAQVEAAASPYYR